MDNIGHLAGPMAIGLWPGSRRRYEPDSSLAGGCCDRLYIQLGRWPTAHYLSVVSAEDASTYCRD